MKLMTDRHDTFSRELKKGSAELLILSLLKKKQNYLVFLKYPEAVRRSF